MAMLSEINVPASETPPPQSTKTRVLSAGDFARVKTQGRKLSLVTCYDYTFARLLTRGPIDALLVGDSAAMVIHGAPSTLSATVEMMRLHTQAVTRGAPEKFVIA